MFADEAIVLQCNKIFFGPTVKLIVLLVLSTQDIQRWFLAFIIILYFEVLYFRASILTLFIFNC